MHRAFYSENSYVTLPILALGSEVQKLIVHILQVDNPLTAKCAILWLLRLATKHHYFRREQVEKWEGGDIIDTILLIMQANFYFIF